jgi:hypothetical protein
MVASTFIGTTTALSSPQIHFRIRRNFVPLIAVPSSSAQPIESPRTSGGRAVSDCQAASRRSRIGPGASTVETRALM